MKKANNNTCIILNNEVSGYNKDDYVGYNYMKTEIISGDVQTRGHNNKRRFNL